MEAEAIEGKKMTILAVEDEQSLLQVITVKLERKGFHVLGARSIEQAENYLDDKDFQIDGVWLDHYLLGQETGLHLVAKMKEENSPMKHVPIFIVSNTASQDNVKSYVALGVSKYFTKIDTHLDGIVDELYSLLKET